MRKKFNVVRILNNQFYFYLIEKEKEEIKIDATYIVQYNENYEQIEEIKKHSNKIILVLDDTISFNNEYPLNIENKLYNIILNANTNLIIPTEKREISYLKLEEKNERGNYYISIYDKEKLNGYKLFFYKNKFKIISIIDINEAIYFYCKKNYGNEEKIYLFNENNNLIYLIIFEQIILDNIKNIKIDEINENRIKEIIKVQNNKEINETVEIKKIEDKNTIIFGAIEAYLNKYSGFISIKKQINFSPIVYNHLLKGCIIILFINLIINFIIFLNLNKTVENIELKIKKIFQENYPELKKIVKVIPQSINYNNRLFDKTEILNEYLNFDNRFLYLFRTIIKHFNKYQNFIMVKNINYFQKSFEISGEAENIRIINGLLEDLKKEEIIKEVNLIKSEYSNILKSEGIDFVINIVIKK